MGTTLTGTRPIAIVTGGGHRVGRAICLQLASRGLDVLLTYHTSHAAAERLAEEIRDSGGGADISHLDLADTNAVESWSRSVAASLPRLDVLVHNASVYEASPLDRISKSDCLDHYAVNALAPMLLSAALSPLLRAAPAPGGAIVAMLDIHTETHPRKNHAAYSMSKAALGAMVRALARDLAPEIRVNGVAPGVVAWPESGPESSPEMQRRYLDMVPLARAGTPEEAARAVAFLALDATYTTGQTLRIDGGRSLR